MENKSTNYKQNAIRRRAMQRHYIAGGIRKLIASPLAGVLVVLILTIAFISAWKAVDTFIPSITTFSLLIPVVTYAAHIFIPTALPLLLAGFLWLLGAPGKRREIEDDVATALGIAKTKTLSYLRPFLISSKTITGSDVMEYVFWTRFIPIVTWNKLENKEAILWALHAHSAESFKHGKWKYTVAICVGSGAKPPERETPQDPLFK